MSMERIMSEEKFYAAPYSVGGPFTVGSTMLGYYVEDRVGNNVGRSSMMKGGAVFFSSKERAQTCCDALNGEAK